MSKVSMPSKIFGTVLSHGLRGRMLTKSELQTLAESRDIEELVTRMKNTVYLDALAKLTKPYTAEKVEGALREYLVNMHAKMVNIAGGSGILNAYFVKYITMNLKLVLKGKALGRTYEELLPKINLRAEELVGRRDLVVKALVAKDFDEAVASLAGSEFGEDAAKAAAAYKEKGDVRLFDTFLDHAFYHALDRAMVTEAASPDVKKLVATDVDAYNVLAVLRGKFWGLSANDVSDLIVTTTPKVTRETLMKMINMEKVQEAIAELGNTVYREIIPQNATNDIDAIMQLEAGFESLALRRVVSSFRAIFTVAIMLSAIKLMMIEVRNLSAIASGVEQRVPAETIMSRLVKLE
ncbi:MAG TPA: V-type ATPase subunit [Nitrososphaera sp.]|nr:V-type ATPase subunit [Nitrososphaera sp.]